MDLKELSPKYAQSIWLDYIRRHLLRSGEFARLVQEDGIRGVTSNPSIFEKAIVGSTNCDGALARYKKREDQTASVIYEHLAVEDIQEAAVFLLPVYEASERRDGYVSMEPSPYLAHDTQATVDEATRLWKRVGRENLMIKVPATAEGIPTIRQSSAEVSTSTSRSSSLARCVARSSRRTWAASKRSPRTAEISLARQRREHVRQSTGRPRGSDAGGARAAPAAQQGELRSLVGKVAIASVRLAYQDWKEGCRGPRWQTLSARGARPQRLLWASTSTKDPRFSDLLYVESLIGPYTVDTIPPATLDAFRDHGKADSRLEEKVEDARQVLAALERMGISIPI